MTDWPPLLLKAIICCCDTADHVTYYVICGACQFTFVWPFRCISVRKFLLLGPYACAWWSWISHWRRLPGRLDISENSKRSELEFTVKLAARFGFYWNISFWLHLIYCQARILVNFGYFNRKIFPNLQIWFGVQGTFICRTQSWRLRWFLSWVCRLEGDFCRLAWFGL